MALTRFRANPRKVRVAICRLSENEWRVTVRNRDCDTYRILAYSNIPDAAVMRALQTAASVDMPGVDLDMQWSYEHPWKCDA